MAAGAAFADILYEKVNGAGKPDATQAASFRPRVIPPHPLLFATPYRPSGRSPYRSVTADTGSTPPRFAAPPSAPPARPSRPLNRRQRQALDAFIALGARLSPDFAPGELRSAFRMLALAYHPDRHPGSSDGERARLTRVLADLNDHHRCLLAALRPAA
jgi:hypothetical protein